MAQQAARSRFAPAQTTRIRNGEFTRQLRAAAAEGDDARITLLLSELLRCKGLSRGQRIALQQQALLGLVQSLRSAALNDDLTGLHNQRAFAQLGTRALDIAARDQRPAHLVYFCTDQLERIQESLGRAAGHILLREAGNLLRDLFPDYGVHEVLGRVGSDEFAAITSNPRFATRDSALSLVYAAQRHVRPPLALSLGIAHFNCANPLGIDELLEEARRDANRPASQLGVELPVRQFGVTALSAYRV